MFRPDKGPRKASKTSYQVRKQHVVSERRTLPSRANIKEYFTFLSFKDFFWTRTMKGSHVPRNKDSEYVSDEDSLASSKLQTKFISSARSSTDASFSVKRQRSGSEAASQIFAFIESPIHGEESDAASSSNSRIDQRQKLWHGHCHLLSGVRCKSLKVFFRMQGLRVVMRKTVSCAMHLART